jgi:hypothetical protein
MMKIITVPPRPKELKILNRRWALAAYALYFLATQPYSARIEHEKQLAEYFDQPAESKRIRNTYRKDLLREGLIYSQTTTYLRGVYAITMIRLSEKGKDLCNSFGWEICENEWERLNTRHSGDDQPKHTASMVVFSLSARQRGWRVTMLPETNVPYFYPDLLLEKDDKRMFVEVELGSRRKEKWNLYKKMQGYAAICAKTGWSRGTLIRECGEMQLGGFATDLQYLVDHRNDPKSLLWIEEWNGTGG